VALPDESHRARHFFTALWGVRGADRAAPFRSCVMRAGGAADAESLGAHDRRRSSPTNTGVQTSDTIRRCTTARRWTCPRKTRAGGHRGRRRGAGDVATWERNAPARWILRFVRACIHDAALSRRVRRTSSRSTPRPKSGTASSRRVPCASNLPYTSFARRSRRQLMLPPSGSGFRLRLEAGSSTSRRTPTEKSARL